MKVKITNKNHKIRKSLDRINEANDFKFYDPNIDTIIVDELDLGNGRYGKTDDVKMFESDEEYLQHARDTAQSLKDQRAREMRVYGERDKYFEYTDEDGDPNEILNRPDLQLYPPNNRFQVVLKRLPNDIIVKEMYKVWNGGKSSLIKKLGKYSANDDINKPPSNFIDHGGYHMNIISGMGPVVTPAGLDSKTAEILDGFANDFIYTGKLSDSRNNPDIKMIAQKTKNGVVYKTVNVRPIKAYIEHAVNVITPMAPHLSAILSKLQIYFVTRVPTMATDGFRIFINPAFVHTLYQQGDHFGVMYVLVHELYHNFLLHHTRHMIRIEEFPDFKRANIAQDLEINHLIEETFPVLKGQTEKQGGCWDPSTVGMLWEDIYKDDKVIAGQSLEHAMKMMRDSLDKMDQEQQGQQDPEQNQQGQPQDGMEGMSGDQGGQQGGDQSSQGGQQSGGQQGGEGQDDGANITMDDIAEIINTLESEGLSDLANKLKGTSSPAQFMSTIINFSANNIELEIEEIQQISEVLRNNGKEEIAVKLEKLIQQGQQGGQGAGQSGNQGGQQGQQGQGGAGEQGEQQGQQNPISVKQRQQQQGMTRDEIQDKINKAEAEGDTAEAEALKRQKEAADRAARETMGGGGVQTVSAQDLLDEIKRLEEAGQQEAADAIRKEIADAYNQQKRENAKQNGTFNEDEQRVTDIKPRDVDKMLREANKNDSGQNQGQFDGTSKHTDHRDVISPEEGDRLVKEEGEEAKRNQNVQEKQMNDLNDLRDIYQKELHGMASEILGNIIDKIKSNLKPAVNWKHVLGAFLKSNITPLGRKTWNKKALVRGEYIRRHRDTRNSGENIIAYVDTSASVSITQLQQFVAELCSIGISCDIKTLYVIPFEGTVRMDLIQMIPRNRMQRYATNPSNFQMNLEGGGGTDFSKVIENLNDRRIKNIDPNAVIIFTDGGDNAMKIPPLPRWLKKNQFLWFVAASEHTLDEVKAFTALYGRILRVLPGKGIVNESLNENSKYAHRFEKRKEFVQRVYKERLEKDPMYQYLFEGEYYDPTIYSAYDVDSIPFDRLEAYSEGLVKTSNEVINNRIILWRLLESLSKGLKRVNKKEEQGKQIANEIINESSDVTEDLFDAIQKSRDLHNS